MAWIRNTSTYPTDEVRRLVKLATRGVNMARVCVNVKGGRGWGGTAYEDVPSISNAPPSTKYLMTVKIGSDVAYPVGPRNYHGEAPGDASNGSRFPFWTAHDWRELLVNIAAHEAKHIDQYRHGKPGSEVKAERFAVKAVERFRVETTFDQLAPEPSEPS